MPITCEPRNIVVPGSVPIHVRIHAGCGPAVVLIHGITATGDIWQSTLAPLARAFTPVTIDLRGHGASGKPSCGYLAANYVDDLDRVLDALGLDRPLIIGHSLGGLVALWWAARHPDRAAALVIEDSPLRSGERFRPAFESWLRLNAMPLDELRAVYAEERPTWTAAELDMRARQMHSTARAVIAELMADSMAHDGVSRIAAFEHIASPTLLIHGDIDTGGMVEAEDARAFGSRLSNATTARIPGGGHSLHIESTPAFLALALPLLERHASNASHVRA